MGICNGIYRLIHSQNQKIYKNLLKIPNDNNQMTKLCQQSSTTCTCMHMHACGQNHAFHI